MPRIAPLHWKTLLNLFVHFGCEYRRKEGSHHILWHPNAKRAVVIPEYREVGLDIIASNMKTVGMTRAQFFELLQKV